MLGASEQLFREIGADAEPGRRANGRADRGPRRSDSSERSERRRCKVGGSGLDIDELLEDVASRA